MAACSCFTYFFFFFQAEDGIRDPLVTGVQTCALPIFNANAAAGVLANDKGVGLLETAVTTAPTKGTVTVQSDGSFLYTANANVSGIDRSEERRVGKEGRSRWWT